MLQINFGNRTISTSTNSFSLAMHSDSFASNRPLPQRVQGFKHRLRQEVTLSIPI